MRFLIIILFSISLYAEESKVLCELDGTYSITYKDIKKTYLSEGIEFFKNLSEIEGQEESRKIIRSYYDFTISIQNL